MSALVCVWGCVCACGCVCVPIHPSLHLIFLTIILIPLRIGSNEAAMTWKLSLSLSCSLSLSPSLVRYVCSPSLVTFLICVLLSPPSSLCLSLFILLLSLLILFSHHSRLLPSAGPSLGRLAPGTRNACYMFLSWGNRSLTSIEVHLSMAVMVYLH